GILTGGVSFGSGVAGGQAFQFDGSSGYIQVPDSPALNPTSAITIDAWFIAANDGSYQPLVSKFNHLQNTGDDSYNLAIVNGQVLWQLDTTNGVDIGDNRLTVTPSMSVTDGQFHHVAATYDGSTMSVYVDGVLAGS